MSMLSQKNPRASRGTIYIINKKNGNYEDKIGIILVNNQLDALFSMYLFLYFTPLHVTSIPVLIIRRIELYQYIVWYMSLCVGDCLLCRSGPS
jgi:hypothetical protein